MRLHLYLFDKRGWRQGSRNRRGSHNKSTLPRRPPAPAWLLTGRCGPAAQGMCARRPSFAAGRRAPRTINGIPFSFLSYVTHTTFYICIYIHCPPAQLRFSLCISPFPIGCATALSAPAQAHKARRPTRPPGRPPITVGESGSLCRFWLAFQNQPTLHRTDSLICTSTATSTPHLFPLSAVFCPLCTYPLCVVATSMSHRCRKQQAASFHLTRSLPSSLPTTCFPKLSSSTT